MRRGQRARRTMPLERTGTFTLALGLVAVVMTLLP
jgi:hypothetical protein